MTEYENLSLFSSYQEEDEPAAQPAILTVTELSEYLVARLREDPILSDVLVSGEISNPLQAKSGHFYFSLKDSGATLSCVMWRSSARRLFEVPQEGQRVVVHGRVDMYAPRGQLQIIVDSLQSEGGIGDLYRRFEETKERLNAEGLFDPERKRPIPSLPHRIGLVTSATGAALRDILQVLSQRWPLADVLLAPCLVQGTQAPAAIQASLYSLYARDDIDVIIVARGGGSIEDLWAFNDEGVARLIAESPMPIVSGVGHETDFTIVDFVADVRAPTPSAAAAAIVPDRFTIQQSLAASAQNLFNFTLERIERRRLAVDYAGVALKRLSPLYRIDQQRLNLEELDRRLSRSMQERLSRGALALETQHQRLQALNPSAVLTRGYAIVQDSQGHVVDSVQQVEAGQRLTVSVSDGKFPVSVED